METYRCHFLSQLLTGSTTKFNNKISHASGFNHICKATLHTYFDLQGLEKVDPRDAHILSLTTALEAKTENPNNPLRTPVRLDTNSNEPTVHIMDTLEQWRAIMRVNR